MYIGEVGWNRETKISSRLSSFLLDNQDGIFLFIYICHLEWSEAKGEIPYTWHYSPIIDFSLTLEMTKIV